MEKFIYLTFANSKGHFVDKLHLSVAVSYVSKHLFNKYGIYLSIYSVDVSSAVLRISSENFEPDFSIGYHLRGLSQFFYRNYPEDYLHFKKGKALFNYTEIPKPSSESEVSLQTVLQKLLDAYSVKDTSKIQRVYAILNE